MEITEKKIGKVASLLRQITGNIPEKAFFSAIIVAAGSSTRMGGGSTQAIFESRWNGCGCPCDCGISELRIY